MMFETFGMNRMDEVWRSRKKNKNKKEKKEDRKSIKTFETCQNTTIP
jgi:hypothetical protein